MGMVLEKRCGRKEAYREGIDNISKKDREASHVMSCANPSAIVHVGQWSKKQEEEEKNRKTRASLWITRPQGACPDSSLGMINVNIIKERITALRRAQRWVYIFSSLCIRRCVGV
jgi:hypothetical protein